MGCALVGCGQTGTNTHSSHFTAIFCVRHPDTYTPALFPCVPALSFRSLLPSFSFQTLPHILLGVHRACALSVTISQSQQGALAAGRPHPSDSLAWEGATITPLGCSTGWGWWSPGTAELLHRALATRALFHSWHQRAPDMVDADEVFCCSCPPMSSSWPLLPLQYLNKTSGCLTPSKPEILVTRWVKWSLVSAAVALLTF